MDIIQSSWADSSWLIWVNIEKYKEYKNNMTTIVLLFPNIPSEINKMAYNIEFMCFALNWMHDTDHFSNDMFCYISKRIIGRTDIQLG